MDAITENAAGYYYYQPVQSFMMHTAAAILFIVCSYISYIIFRVKNKYDAKYPPFAPGGMWNHMKMITSSEFPWWLLDVSKQLRTGGVFQLSLPVFPTKHFVVVGDPTVVRAISTDPTTLKPGAYKFLDVISGGPTILSSNSQTWHAKRKAAAPAFSSNHNKRMTKVAADITETWVNDKLAVLSNNNGSFDVGREMILIILMALSETAFEYKMSKQEANLFKANLDIALVEFTRKSPGNPFRQSFFGRILPERRKAFHARDSTHGLICHIMAEYRRKKEKNSTTPGTIIELVMESDAFPTNQSKMAQLMEFLLAGHDTTAYTISWILICLANHPKEQAKLRASLVDLSTENWRNCEFLRNVIKEGMRLYPAARSGASFHPKLTEHCFHFIMYCYTLNLDLLY